MSLQIGQYIAYALGEENAPDLYHRIGGRIAPVVQPEDEQTQMPYIWYYSEGMTESETKDGWLGDTCTVLIEVVAPTYPQLLDLLGMVRHAMALAPQAWEDQDGPFHVDEQTFTAGAEEYDDAQQAYCRKLTYTIETYE